MNEQYRDICRSEFAKINQKLDRLDMAIRGNGKPGIATRIDRLEQSGQRRSKLGWLIVAAVVGNIVSVVFWIMRS